MTPWFSDFEEREMTSIWDPITIGHMYLPQRITMSPMTRSRALDDGTPSPLAVEYPDFISRLRRSAPLNDPDPATFYTGGARGYADYPTLDQCETDPAEEAW
jgi:2,4-dienoyl-CoA reductase-like NADH-dependent reductase (Old Yellow Enzyme family)